jgi:hypothetical protein
MPFASKAQARYMFSQHPDIAQEFAAATPSIKALPNRVKKPKKSGTFVPLRRGKK